jgi:hypothetical protein
MAEENIGAFKHVEVSTDGVTVWVNTEVGCIARFGRGGIDIHRATEAQAVLDQCLFCTHAASTKTDWFLFVQKVQELYKFKVPQEYMPRRFRG